MSTPRAASSARVLDGRVTWIDTAKSIAIFLIVVYHVSGWFFALVFLGSTHPLASLWAAISAALIPVRIPLFFLVSGLLATRAIRRPWGDLLRTRIIDLLWPFLIWSVLISPLWSIRLEATGSAHLRPVLDAIVFGSGHLWFLPALVVFLVVAKLVARVPIVAIVSAAVLAYAIRGPLVAWANDTLYPAIALDLSRWSIFLVWFLLGCFANRIVFGAARYPWPLVLTTAIAFGTLFWLGPQVGPPAWWAALLSVSGVSALIGASVLLSRLPAVRRLSRYVASRTLAIYVGHAFLLEVLADVLLAYRSRVGPLDLSVAWVMVLFVPVVAVFVTWLSLWMHDRAVAGRLRVLYRPPARWRSALR